MENQNNNMDQKVHASQEHQIRVEKIEKIRALGIQPWPAVKKVNAATAQVLKEFDADTKKEYQIAGRVMTKRLHGKAAFATIQDQSGRLQVYFKVNDIGQEAFNFFEHLVDIGDILWLEGYSFLTQRGEITLHVTSYSLQSKCLFPLPEKFHGLTDIEMIYRQRYLDLIANEQSKQRFLQRSLIVQAIRNFLQDRDYLEVETPMLHPIPGGAAAKPFITHHNALGDDFYLRIAPELYLKRLVVGGFEKVFEINRNFRNEGISTRHNPEFTMIECYTAFQDYYYGMELTEDMIKAAAQKIKPDMQFRFGNHALDFSQPFERITLHDAVKKYHKLSEFEETAIDKLLLAHKVALPKSGMSLEEKIYLLFSETVESQFIQPTFVTGFPIEVSPLSKADAKHPHLAARAELFVAGMEIANLYNELNDPFEQAARFKMQAQAHEAGDAEAHHYDQDYVHALEYALPPTVGLGIGIDRLAMLLTHTTSIKDVILFPTLKRK